MNEQPLCGQCGGTGKGIRLYPGTGAARRRCAACDGTGRVPPASTPTEEERVAVDEAFESAARVRSWDYGQSAQAYRDGAHWQHGRVEAAVVQRTLRMMRDLCDALGWDVPTSTDHTIWDSAVARVRRLAEAAALTEGENQG